MSKKEHRLGDVVRYFDRHKQDYVNTSVVLIQDWRGREGGKYLTLSNDVGIHEDQVVLISRGPAGVTDLVNVGLKKLMDREVGEQFWDRDEVTIAVTTAVLAALKK